MDNPYDFTPEKKAKILAAIMANHTRVTGQTPLPCPVCGRWNWEMADGFASVPVLKNVWTGDRITGLPCAALVCTDCGNTLFFNLIVLGFALEIGPDLEEMRKRWTPK